MALCNRCQQTLPDEHMLEHIERLHPDIWGGLERWPDGEVVIHDYTLEPEDFEA